MTLVAAMFCDDTMSRLYATGNIVLGIFKFYNIDQ